MNAVDMQKLVTIAENQQKVYDAGYSQSELDFWNNFVKDRTTWHNLFYGWGYEYIRPPFKIKIKSTDYPFYKCVNLKVVESKYFDFSISNPSDTNSGSGINRVFENCFKLEHIEDIGLPAGYYMKSFYNCSSLHTIDVLRSNNTTCWNNAFGNCSELTEIGEIEGEIGQNGFDVSSCPKMSHDTLMRIINALYDYSTDTSGTTHSIKFGTTNLAKLSDAEKAIATQKGWTLS